MLAEAYKNQAATDGDDDRNDVNPEGGGKDSKGEYEVVH